MQPKSVGGTLRALRVANLHSNIPKNTLAGSTAITSENAQEGAQPSLEAVEASTLMGPNCFADRSWYCGCKWRGGWQRTNRLN